MTDVLTRAERIARAQTAERLLEEIRGHITQLQEDYKAEWARPTTDAEQRDRLWFKLQALTDLTKDIVTIMNDGRVAEEEEEHDRSNA